MLKLRYIILVGIEYYMQRFIGEQKFISFLQFIIIIICLSWAISVQAQNTYTIIVNSEVDADLATLNANTTCDLREAIAIANTGVDTGGDCAFVPIGAIDLTADDFVIRFDMTSGAVADELTIPLQTPLPTITSTVDIGGYGTGGPSATSRVFIEAATATGTGVGLDFGINTGNSAINANNSQVTGLIIRNFGIGVRVNDVTDVNIGTNGTGFGNFIYNNLFGIDVNGISTSRTNIRNNAIGITETDSANGNSIHGISIGTDAQITVIENNIIGGNGLDGIRVLNADDVTIQNNFIGVLPSTNANINNNNSGIFVGDSTDVDIIGNTIGFNGARGIEVNNSPSSFLIANNIGTLSDATTAIPNGLDGILVTSSNNTRVLNGLIFNNGGNGVSVTGSQGVTIEEVLIFNNGGLGIDLNLDGVTPNDVGDSDNNQNYTVIDNAVYDAIAGTLTITGTLPSNGVLNTLFYVNPLSACDGSGFGEGRNRLLDGGSPSFYNSSGGVFTAILSGTYNVGDLITAITINRTTDNTSEFAECVAIESTIVADFIPLTRTVIEGTTILFTNLSTGPITNVRWYVNGMLASSSTAIIDYSQLFTTAGIYNIRLEVENSVTGLIDFQTGIITVLAPPPTNTPTPIPVINTPVTPVDTAIPPSDIPTDIPTLTIIPTQTLVPTRTTIPTRTPVPTRTPIPTRTLAPTRTPIPTRTLAPTRTLIPTATDVPPTATFIPTATDLPPTATLIPTETLVPTVTGTPDLAVTVVGNGENEMSVFVVNVGDNAANNVLIQEVLRAGVEFRAALPSAPICTEVGGIVACRIGTIVGGAEASVNFTVQTNGESPDSGITIVTADGVAPQIIDEPFISKIGNPPVAEPGSEITYTIRVINPTDDSAFDMLIQDVMPDIIDILDAEASAGTLTINGQNIRLEIDELAAGERVILTIQALVRDDEDAQEIRNTACVTSSSNLDPNCAVMSFLAVEALPPSGEISLFMQILRGLAIGLFMMGIFMGGRWIYRRLSLAQ